jgi:hypothetical protein
MSELPGSVTGMTLEEFDEASNHPYECKCELCEKWRQEIGEEEEDGSEHPNQWGP